VDDRFGGAALWAQGTSRLHGTVSDRSAAVAPGAMLTVTNTQTGITGSTQSSHTGSFVFSQLPAGAYELKAEAQGFKSYLERNITLRVDENRLIDVAMELGAVTGRGQAQNDLVPINGGRPNSNNYQLDNTDHHDPFFNSPSISPSPDALEEFSTQTSSYGADRGRNGGAFMTAVTKSGTNQFHGSVFEFLRNDKLNARRR
jgi:hypothetical protein